MSNNDQKSRNKPNRTLIIIAAAIAALLYICAVLLFGRQKSALHINQTETPTPVNPLQIGQAKKTSMQENVEQVTAIDAMNAKNGGLLCNVGDLTYICDPNGGIMIERGSDPAGTISDAMASSIFCYGEWIYYCDEYEDGAVCRMDLQGGNRQVLTKNQSCTGIDVCNDKVYYVSNVPKSKNTAIYVINLDGGNPTPIFETRHQIVGLSVYNDIIYFMVWGEKNQLYRMSIADKKPVLLRDQTVDYAFYQDKLILSREDGIVMADENGHIEKRLCDYLSVDTQVFENTLLFCNADKNGNIYSLDLSRPDAEPLLRIQYGSTSISLGRGVIYYKSTVKNANGALYRFIPNF